jgi:hypothetical protein
MSTPADQISAAERLGDVTAALRLTSDCVLLLGWMSTPVAAEGRVAIEARPESDGKFRAASWPRADGGSWFIAAVRIDGGEARPGERLRLAAPKRPATIACLPGEFLDVTGFATETVVRLGAHAVQATSYLIDNFGVAARSIESVRHFLVTLLDAVTGDDGVIELAGQLGNEAVFIQGWSRDMVPGETHAIIVGGGAFELRPALLTSFARADLQAPAAGLVGTIAHGPAPEPGRRVYLRMGSDYRRLSQVPQIRFLAPSDSPAQLQAMLPALHGPASALAAIRALLRPRFSGQDTISSLPLPIRLASDVTFRVEHGGFYLTGWMLDPGNLVSAVRLRGTRGFSERIDTIWTRTERPDVTSGYNADPLFAGRIEGDRHGFAVFVAAGATPPAGEQYYIELEVGPDHAAFAPLGMADLSIPEARQRLFRSIDFHKPSSASVIERQAGRFVVAMNDLRAAGPEFDLVDAAMSDPRVAVILPIVDAQVPVGVLLSQFALSPLGEGEGLVIAVAPAVAEPVLAALRKYLTFYGLRARIAVAQRDLDICGAFEVGAAATAAETLVFLAPTVRGRQPGWIGRLAKLAAGEALTAVSPTLLYEDFSVRFAGLDAVTFEDAAPFARLHLSHAGYPTQWVRKEQSRKTLAASLDCCAISRAAFARLGGFAPGYTLPTFKAADFFLRLTALGGEVLWAPEIEAYALDDAQASDLSAQAAEAADGWGFGTAWRDRLSTSTSLDAVG